jgi:hypothetical protein
MTIVAIVPVIRPVIKCIGATVVSFVIRIITVFFSEKCCKVNEWDRSRRGILATLYMISIRITYQNNNNDTRDLRVGFGLH